MLKSFLPNLIVDRIQRHRLDRHLACFPGRIARHTYHDVCLEVIIGGSLAEGWYDRDWPQLPELAMLQSGQLQAGARVFDLGAHQGVVAMILSRMVGRKGEVIAVEGTAYNVATAKKNFALNQIQNVKILHAVAADRAGVPIGFSETLNGRASAGSKPLESVSIDSLAEKYGFPRVVLLDVEGYECPVLRGAAAALRQSIDFFVEVHSGCGLENHGSLEELIAFFDLTRFDLFLPDGEYSAFRAFSPERLPSQKFFLVALAKTERPRPSIATSTLRSRKF
jgi:FkbM family methyltransferase